MTGRPWSSREVVTAARAHAESLQAEQQWYDEQLKLHRRDLHGIDGETEAAWQHLVAVIVPALEADRLDRVAAACQLPSVASAAVAVAQQLEVDRLHRSLAEIDGAHEYVQREGLLVECELRIAEVDEMIAPLSSGVSVVLGDAVWQRLRSAGYGMPGYPGKWYRLSYYRDWKESDQIVEQYGPALGVTTWDALRAKVIEAEGAMTTLKAERDEYAARRARIEALVRGRVEAEQALAAVPARTLAAVHGRLRSHLEPLGLERVASMLAGDPTIAVALQRLAGLAAKRRYLEEAAEHFLKEPREQVAAALVRDRRDIEKLSRPKNAGRQFPADSMEKRFRDRSAAIGKRRQRYGETREHVVQFTGYERGSMAQDFLWWNLMTNNRVDGSYITEVYDHQARYPQDAHADAIAAVAHSSSQGDDTLLMHDGS